MNIRNRNLIITLAGLGILGASATSSAQSTTVANPIRVEIGGFFPTSSTVTDTLRRTALYGGVSYDLYGWGGPKAATPTVAGLYVDASYNSSGGIQLTQIGVGLQGRVYTQPSTYGKFYLGAGIGAYFLNSNGFFSTSNFTELGGKVFVGYEMSNGFFLEGGYTLIGDVRGVNPSGFQAAIGKSF